MLGIVFTEFFEMVEEKFSYEMVDDLINMSTSESKGVYTAIGSYDHKEIVEHVVNLHKKTEIPIPDLLKTFGRYLHGTFAKNYTGFFDEANNAFDFLESIERYIHVEVKKLYPNAELPTFNSERIGDNQMILHYKSDRRMGDFAFGLIEKTLEYYKEPADINMTNTVEDGSVVKFMITKK